MKTLCAPTVKTDAYTVFSKMLKEDILLPTETLTREAEETH